MKKNFLKNFLFSACAVFAAQCLFAELPFSTPEKEGVSSEGILSWINACEKELSHVHGFAILRNGKIISEGYWKPYSKNQVHQLFSVSKSFTSSAIGFLADEGKIKLDEKVLDIFPEKAPSNPSPYLKSMKIRDLLTMTSGHNSDTIHKISINSSDWIKSFFSLKMDYAPGSRFVYNTGATYMLSAIAEKRSGMKLFDYLDGKLFAPLGITDAVTTTCPAGIACGGYGMSMTVRDLATFGQFLLQKGNWNGKQLLSKEWIESATSKQVDNSNLKTPDYTQGYGFQFWRCTHNAYRADGARGQFIIVIPEENMVVAMTSGLSNMQKPMDLVWKHILPANSKAPLPENKNAYQRLKEKCAALSMPVVTGEREGLSAAENQEYEYTKNEDNIKNFKLVTTKNGWEIVFANEAGSQRIPIGYGKWLPGTLKFNNKPYEIFSSRTGTRSIASSGAWTNPDTFFCRTFFTDGPAYIDFTIRFTTATITANVKIVGIPSLDITLTGVKK